MDGKTKYNAEPLDEAWMSRCLAKASNPTYGILLYDEIHDCIVENNESFTVYIGHAKHLNAMFCSGKGISTEFVWTSSDENVAVTSSVGGFIARGKGHAVITAKHEWTDSSVSIDVYVLCGEKNPDDVTKHEYALEKDGHCVCRVCKKALPSPLLEDYMVLSEIDMKTVDACTTAAFEYYRNNSDAMKDDDAKQLFKKPLRMIDEIRQKSEYRGQYAYRTMEGMCLPMCDMIVERLKKEK